MKVKIALVAMAMAWMFPVHAGEEKIPWADVPAAAQKTIQDHAGGGQILEVEKETEHGKIVYEAKVKRPDGKTVEIEVAADGKLIEVEEED